MSNGDEYAGTFDGSWRAFWEAMTKEHLPVVQEELQHILDSLHLEVERSDEDDEPVEEWNDKHMSIAKELVIPYLEEQKKNLPVFISTLGDALRDMWPDREDYRCSSNSQRTYGNFIFDVILTALAYKFGITVSALY